MVAFTITTCCREILPQCICSGPQWFILFIFFSVSLPCPSCVFCFGKNLQWWLGSRPRPHSAVPSCQGDDALGPNPDKGLILPGWEAVMRILRLWSRVFPRYMQCRVLW